MCQRNGPCHSDMVFHNRTPRSSHMKIIPVLIITLVTAVTLLLLARNDSSSKPAEKAKVEVVESIGIYKLPVGDYALLSIRSEGFAAPDHQTLHYVYLLMDLESQKLTDVMLICGPNELAAVGSILKVTGPGKVQSIQPN